MALKKVKQIKWINAEYWKIYRNDQSMADNNTCVRLGLYTNKDTRDLDVMNFLELQAYTFDGVDYSRADLYAKIKESKMAYIVVKEAVYGEAGEILEEEVKELTETNWFVDAIDC